MHAPASLRAGRARWQGGICRGAGVAPGPSLRSRARSRTHVLLIKSSAGSSGSRSPGPRQALVTPGARARLQGCLPSSEIKLPLKSAWGPRRRGDQKGKGPGGEKGVLFPFAGEELAPVSSLPRSSPPTPPHPSDLQLCLQSSPSSPTLLPLAPPGAAQSSSWATSSSPSPGVPQLRPHSPPPSPQR